MALETVLSNATCEQCFFILSSLRQSKMLYVGYMQLWYKNVHRVPNKVDHQFVAVTLLTGC